MAMAAVVMAGWWLRDPAWLANYRHGFHAVEMGDDGRPYQWTGGRAAFFVPSDAGTVSLDIGGHDRFTTQVSISVDGHMMRRVTAGPDWQTVTMDVTAIPTSRRHRRIELHVGRAWGDDRKGVRVR